MKKNRAKKRQPSKVSVATKRRAVKSRSRKSTGTVKAARQHDIKQLARRWFDELWNRRNPDALLELMDPAATGHTEGGSITGHDEFRQKLHAPFLGAFPDLQVTLDDILADKDDAAVRWTLRGTHAGDTLGFPATHRRVSVTGITWLRYKNGRVIAGWDRWNLNGLMAYLQNGTECATVCALKDAS